MTERMKFVTRLQAGERMTDLCKEFGVSRKTGYKILDRFRKSGVDGLYDESRRPRRVPHETSDEVKELIYECKAEHPTWGAPKIQYELEKKHSGVPIPGTSTIHKWLKRKGLVHKRKPRRKASPTKSADLVTSQGPNDLWCVDFKGQFRTGDRRYCYPLTISDHHSRYLLSCHGLPSTRGIPVRAVFEDVFAKYGLPNRIRSDNGSPFASTGFRGWTTLSVWWMRLGITVERIQPGCPQQNGRHERIHLTLKQDVLRPPAPNAVLQQESFDRFSQSYNHERPHASLEMKSPGDFYSPSTRPYPTKLAELEYPLHDVSRRVRACGRIHLFRRNHCVQLGAALRGERVGLREIEVNQWLVTFATIDLGVVDSLTGKFDRI